MKKLIYKSVPWLITIVALYVAFKGVKTEKLLEHAGDVKPAWIGAAFALTIASYLLRSWRWQTLFPEKTMSYLNSARVLWLGFFMNNVLPARAGELVRAHMGGRLSGQMRTLVLATIASERLVDGLTISLMFVFFALRMGDATRSREFLYVAYFFGAASIAVLVLLACRGPLFRLIEKLAGKLKHSRASAYTLDRVQVFINGLAPLSSPRRLIRIAIESVLIWMVELCVYKTIGYGFQTDLSWAQSVLFLVAVNFASLIPSAPAGIGVIEAIATGVLKSVGFSQELALTLVITQHAIQYIVIGAPGALLMLSWRRVIEQAQQENLAQA